MHLLEWKWENLWFIRLKIQGVHFFNVNGIITVTSMSKIYRLCMIQSLVTVVLGLC
ncbi:Uncharacterised protein [Mycobacterium tuberculosis]|nr:Uncharacterised protein [Mycobacterium tuberculosis]